MSELFKAIDEFVNRPRDPKVAERVSKYVSKAKSKGWTTDDPILQKSDEEVEMESGEWNPTLAFFSPVGYRPLFEQELLFLLSDGHTYESVLQMPVHIRKKLIDRKLEIRKGLESGGKSAGGPSDEAPDIPPGLLEQFRVAAQSRREAETPLPPR